MKNVVIPEGTEKIGNHWFWGSGIESVTVAASVREIGADAFCNSKSLRQITFAEGSRLEKIGRSCFSGSGIEEITLPGTVKEVGDDAFKNCSHLRVVWEENGCRWNSWRRVDDNVPIFSAGMKVGDKLLRDLRRQKDVVIPDGIEEIGKQWF